MNARIDPELADLLSGDPLRPLEAIIMAQGRLEDLVDSLPADVTVRYTYRLIGSISVTAPAGALRLLASSDAVKAIEPVRPVTHC